MWRHWAWLGLVSGVLIAACGGSVSVGGGSGDSGNGAGGPGESGAGPAWVSYCNTRASNCGIDGGVCKGQEGCAKALLRDDIEDFLFDCLTSACNEDECFAQIEAGFSPTPAGQGFLETWQVYMNACPAGNNDVSLAAWIIADDRLGPFQACAAKPSCAEAEACFDQVNKAEIDVCQGWL